MHAYNLLVVRVGVEPTQPEAGDLQSLGLTDAQPNHVLTVGCPMSRILLGCEPPHSNLGESGRIRTYMPEALGLQPSRITSYPI